MVWDWRGGLGVEEGGAGEEVFAGDELLGGHRGDVWVCYPPVCVGKGDAEGFDDGVDVRGRVVVVLGESGDLTLLFEDLEHAQGHEGDDALAVGRVFPYVHAFRRLVVHGVAVGLGDALGLEVELDWVDFFAALVHVVLEVVEGDETAFVLQNLD